MNILHPRFNLVTLLASKVKLLGPLYFECRFMYCVGNQTSVFARTDKMPYLASIMEYFQKHFKI